MAPSTTYCAPKRRPASSGATPWLANANDEFLAMTLSPLGSTPAIFAIKSSARPACTY